MGSPHPQLWGRPAAALLIGGAVTVASCDPSDRPYVSLEPTGTAQFGPCIGDVFGRVQLTPTGYGTVVSPGTVQLRR